MESGEGNAKRGCGRWMEKCGRGAAVEQLTARGMEYQSPQWGAIAPPVLSALCVWWTCICRLDSAFVMLLLVCFVNRNWVPQAFLRHSFVCVSLCYCNVTLTAHAGTHACGFIADIISITASAMQIIPITTLVPLLIFYLQSFSVNSSHALSKSISIPAMGAIDYRHMQKVRS